MENKITGLKRDDDDDDQSSSKEIITLFRNHGSEFSRSKSHKLLRMIKKSKQIGVKTLVHRSNSNGGSIPRPITSFDEKYLHRFLELIHNTASRSTVPALGSSRASAMHDDGGGGGEEEEEEDEEETSWVVGTITGSESMMNIMKSPLFCQLSALADPATRKDPIDFTESETSSCARSLFSSPKPEKTALCHHHHHHHHHRRPCSWCERSSTNSSCSDRSCSSPSTVSSRGMLQRFGSDAGSPHFVFSVDGREDAYEARRCASGTLPDGPVDCVYSVRRRVKEHPSDLVGKMTVSSSHVVVVPGGARVLETEFVLFGIEEARNPGNIQTRGGDGVTRKIARALRAANASRHRTLGEMGTILEDPNSDFIGSALPANLELAAVVVRDGHGPPVPPGWGFNFLKKLAPKAHRGVSSVNVILPAGFHGGPSRSGPSTLTQRWRSGGSCDCGGWDAGCPLTVMHDRPGVHADADDCRSLDLFVEGYERRSCPLRVVNIHEDLYFVHFGTELSALQSFSVAVSVILGKIHPSLRR